MQKVRLRTNIPRPPPRGAFCCVHVLYLSDLPGQFQRENGQSAIADEFGICWRWFIRALKRSVLYLTPGSTSNRPQPELTALTNHGTILLKALLTHLNSITLNMLGLRRVHDEDSVGLQLNGVSQGSRSVRKESPAVPWPAWSTTRFIWRAQCGFHVRARLQKVKQFCESWHRSLLSDLWF